MVIMPVIIPVAPHVPREEQINAAALRYSSNAPQQLAFKAGAHWADGPDLSCGATLLAIVLIMLGITQFVAILSGLMSGTSSYYGKLVTNKWKYVFFMYNPAIRFSRWMSKE